MGKPWRVHDDLAGLEAIGINDTIGTPLPSFLQDERDVLDCEEWDDLETAAWLEQRPWADLRGDDPLDPLDL